MAKKSGYQAAHNIISFKHKLERVKNLFSDKGYTVSYSYDEFTSVCPKTGLPDFGTIYIDYTPKKWVIEEKSMKFYLISYRNVGIFKEFAAVKILSDFVEITKPKWARLVGEFKSRGGLPSTVRLEFKNNKIVEIIPDPHQNKHNFT